MNRASRYWLIALVALLLAFAGALLASAPQRTSTPKRKTAIAAGRRTSAVDAVRLNNLGVAYMNQQRIEQALAFFEKAAAADPRLAAAKLNIGIALMNLQRQEPALKALAAATQARPDDARSWYNLALAYRNAGENEKSLEAFKKVAELDPGDPDVHYFLGVLYTQAQRYEPAIQALERAIELNPFHVSAEFGLARALQRSGKQAEARQHLARFDHLQKGKLGAPISLIYGEQGKYSLAEEVRAAAQQAPPAIPVRFTDVTAASGLPKNRAAAGCLLDLDDDGRTDVVLVSDDGTVLLRNAGGGFENVTRAASIPKMRGGSACAAGDYDNDGRVDLFIAGATGVAVLRNSAKGEFVDASEQSGMKLIEADALLLVDADHDGDLDLLAGASDGFWRNNGNGTFSNQSAEAGMAYDEVAPDNIHLIDFNNDRAVDVVLGVGERAQLLLNPREGAWKAAAVWPAGGPLHGSPVAIADFDKDGWMDVVLANETVWLWGNQGGKTLKQESLPIKQSGTAATLDFDNDGLVDLVVASGSQTVLLRNVGSGRFSDVSRASTLASVAASTVLAADFDGDGDTDLLALTSGAPRLLRNDGGNRNNSLRLSFKGLNDNKSAIGTKVEVFAGDMYQKFEITQPVDLLVGLGARKQADVVRMLWPTGVLQDEIELAAGKPHHFDEIDRRGSSCPIVFAWDGERYEFISDVIGAGIVGHWVAPNTRNTPDPNEYLKISGSQLRERDGRLSLKFIEPMEEVVFLDQARLYAVDHPAGFEVYPNEYFAGPPPFPEFKLIASRNPQPPRAALADGRDVLPALRERDRQYVTGFHDAPYKGFAELHALELELPAPYAGGLLRMLMHGFTDYFTATSVYAAHQANVTAVVPYVEAQDNRGQWKRVIDNIGFPAGLLRTMTADLTGKLPAGTRRLRIWTNLKIYWDQVLFETNATEPPVKMTEAALSAARLAFRGYPREQRGGVPADVSYRYDEVSATGPYARHAGMYTRYGDVRPLLTAAEDRFVILGSGDEISLEFEARSLPPLPPGWKRDYLFYAYGYSKDMDFHEAHSATVEPLPYGSMPGYPYDPAREEAAGYDEYRLEINTRQESGRGSRAYRFSYAPKSP